MRTCAWLMVAALAASADETTTMKWLADEHAKLGAAAKKDGLAEESVAAFTTALRAMSDHAEAGRGLKEGRRPWVLKWDDATHAKYLAFEKGRQVVARESAARLVTLGDERKAAGSAKRAEAAWRWALEQDPECQAAHDRLGEVLVEKDGWYPREEAEKRKQGLLPVGAEWVPAKDAEARHSKWAEAWVEKGAHFEVTSNVSRDVARSVLARAEDVYRAVTRDLHGLIEPPKTDGLMKLSCFATRADFNDHIKAAHGDREELRALSGYFSADDKMAHFLPTPNTATGGLDDDVRREATHQILSWVWKPKGNPEAHVGYWAWVGIALFFESVETRDGKLLTGSPDHVRVRQFRRDFVEGKHVVLAKFTGFAAREIADKPSQCAALANFFMTSGRARYREQFIAYAKAVHEGVAEFGTFQQCFRKEAKDLQAEWEAWVDGLK
ncbi:MAG: hypothetical protein AAB074_01555 [Planctomycetota bacterium]